MEREVIIACDFSSREETESFLSLFGEVRPFIKIGMELFYKEGPSFVEELSQKGFKIFLDLKLHDIPNTVYKAMKNIAGLGIKITNLHAAGGIEMMKAGLKGLKEGAKGETPKLIAVTQLTSISEEALEKELLIKEGLNNTVRHYAKNAKEAGLDGVVCSPLEAPIIKELNLISVTPGIRLESDSKDDQKRIATPAIARELGSSYIVVGRSITASENPLAVYNEFTSAFRG